MVRRRSDAPPNLAGQNPDSQQKGDLALLTPVAGTTQKPTGHRLRSLAAQNVPDLRDSAQDLETLIHRTLADQLDRLSQNIEKARAVQKEFLPQTLPTVAGIDLFTVLRPATEVSGDFYDFILPTKEDVYFSMGDVSSKGMSAALLMPVICKVLRMAVKHLDKPDPQALLTYIHDDMYSQLSNATMFATMFIGHYQPQRRLLTYANAGHSPVIYKPHHKRARLLQADGTPIGLLDQNTWQNQELRLNPGDLLVVGTDGLVEHRNAMRTMFGYDRLLTLIDRFAAFNAQEIAGKLFDAIHHFSANQPSDDDQAVMVIKGI